MFVKNRNTILCSSCQCLFKCQYFMFYVKGKKQLFYIYMHAYAYTFIGHLCKNVSTKLLIFQSVLKFTSEISNEYSKQ